MRAASYGKFLNLRLNFATLGSKSDQPWYRILIHILLESGEPFSRNRIDFLCHFEHPIVIFFWKKLVRCILNLKILLYTITKSPKKSLEPNPLQSLKHNCTDQVVALDWMIESTSDANTLDYLWVVTSQ